MTGAPENAPGVVVHGTCVATGERGLLILGQSGRGKSALALQLIALGAELVSDDLVHLAADGADGLRATCPSPAGQDLIEARYFGLLRLPSRPSARLVLALDLDQAETHRLPPPAWVEYLGRRLPLARGFPGAHLAPALICHLRGAARLLGG